MTFRELDEEVKYQMWSAYVQYQDESGFPALDYVPYCEWMEEISA